MLSAVFQTVYFEVLASVRASLRQNLKQNFTILQTVSHHQGKRSLIHSQKRLVPHHYLLIPSPTLARLPSAALRNKIRHKSHRFIHFASLRLAGFVPHPSRSIRSFIHAVFRAFLCQFGNHYQRQALRASALAIRSCQKATSYPPTRITIPRANLIPIPVHPV
jgi:hypothetical protein